MTTPHTTLALATAALDAEDARTEALRDPDLSMELAITRGVRNANRTFTSRLDDAVSALRLTRAARAAVAAGKSA